MNSDKKPIKYHAPSITFLNWSGDVTITWDESNKEAILKLVEEKMKEDYRFFIIKPRFIRIFGNKTVKLTSVSDLNDAKALVLPDATAQIFLKSVQDTAVAKAIAKGHAVPAKVTRGEEADAIRPAASASEVLTSQTVAVRAVFGG